jgi:hypothetical protein
MSITIIDEPGIKSGVYYHENKLAELEAAIPKWISVEDELPEVREGCAQGCLVMYKRHKEQTHLVYGIGYLWKHGWSVNNYRAIVTHWMPLPAPPVV